ncbi:hypothetical protein CH92_02680 [Stutzerimonas stutzeri]|uniref:DUF7079 domain-containing protein n=2 Tax=Stutzerimonas stutzeri TaxID=316 RepID=W8RPX0_STUST|nr:hypothetical protein CH92_02680 [Stutzerimonas stutzeri]
MGGLSTRQDQIRLWAALSDVFVDNAVDYASVARNLKGYERSAIETAFFVAVAPACYSNLQAPVPPIWTAFDSAWLAERIDCIREARRSSSLRRLLDRAFIANLRYRLKPEWQRIEMALDQQK